MNVLMIDDRVPCEYLGAGYPRANAIVRALLPHCERFAFYPLMFPDRSSDDAHAAFDARIEVLYSRGPSKLAATLAQYAHFDVIWVSRPDNMRLVDAALRSRPDLRRRLTLVYDAEALYAARTAGVYASHGQPLDAAATDALYDDELALAAQADVLISVSAAEAQLFAQRTGKPTFVVGFTTLPAPGTAGFAERSGLGFIGGIRPDSPNEDSLLWYAANVMHAVHARTGALLHVAGFIDSQPVLAFAGAECAIHGPIAAPALLFDRVRVFIAPTRFAAGLPQKLIDAAAAGVPIVTTSLLARALGWESERELLVADDAPAFAAACVRLLGDRDVWERLRQCALQAVGRGFGAEVFGAQLDAAVEAIAAQPRGRADVTKRGGHNRRAAHAPLGLTFVNGYRIYPALNGGHRRILDAYTGFGSAAEVDFISLGADPLDGGYHRIDDRHGEIRVPKALEHVRSEAQANGRTGTGVGQIYLADFALHTPAFGATLQQSLERAEIAIVGSPYVYPVVRARFNGPIVYHAHDVEALLQADLLAGTPCAPELLDHIETLERDCARDAALIVAMSQDDVNRFAERYRIAPELGFALPPSVDLSQARRRLARRGQGERAVAVFVGSHWQPNVAGVRALIELAPALPEIDFVIVGGVADAFAAVVPPRNLRFTGFIPDTERTALLLTADVALNPCQAESGVNMKMTDYVLASLPIVSTPSGARGLGFTDGVHARLVPLSSFGSALRALCREPEHGTRLAENALERLRIAFDLQRNRAALFERLSGLLAAQPGVPSKAMV